MSVERWKLFVGNSNYLISDAGRVKNVITNKLLNPWATRYGYLLVTLYPEKRKVLISRSVLEAFDGPSPPGWYAHHKDGIKKHNFRDNLEWVSPSKNNQHAIDTGLRTGNVGLKHVWTKLRDGEVWLIRKIGHGKIIQQKTIALMFKVDASYISLLLNFKCRKGVV
jgi:hypothetical protein